MRVEFNPEKHEYDGGRKISVTKALVRAGLIDTAWFTEFGRDRGSAVHLATRYYDEGDLDIDSIDPAVRPYLDAYRAYREETGWIWSAIEEPMAGAGFAGTPDRIAKAPTKAIIDIKTGAFQPWHSIQLAAYAAMTGDPFRYERIGLYLTEDGKFSVRVFPKSEYFADINVFQSCVNIANWKRRNNK